MPVEKLRVLTGNVGGSFGMKSSAYPEYVCLLYAARTLGRPVKWTDERSESFLSDSHGRDHEMTADALSEFGIRHIDMPATPLRIWQAIQEARGT